MKILVYVRDSTDEHARMVRSVLQAVGHNAYARDTWPFKGEQDVEHDADAIVHDDSAQTVLETFETVAPRIVRDGQHVTFRAVPMPPRGTDLMAWAKSTFGEHTVETVQAPQVEAPTAPPAATPEFNIPKFSDVKPSKGK